MRFNRRVLATHLYRSSCVEGRLRVRLTRPLRAPPASSATATAGLANGRLPLGSRLASNVASTGHGPEVSPSSGHRYTTEDDLNDARRVARDIFGIVRLRPEQEAGICRVLGGQNAMVVGPVHSGRSLCYLVYYPAGVQRSTLGSSLISRFQDTHFGSSKSQCSSRTHTGRFAL